MSVRTEKLGSIFSKEISMILLEEAKDKDLKQVTITGCDVTNDLSFAKVYFTALNNDYKDEVIEALNNASSFIEMELSKRIDIRKMPKISFLYDNSIEYGNKIEEKIREINSKEV